MVTSNDFEAKLAELEQWFKQHKWLPENIGEFLICIWLVHPIEVDIVANGKANLKKKFSFHLWWDFDNKFECWISLN